MDLNLGWLDAQCSVLGCALIDARCVPEILHRTRESDYTRECLTVFRAIRKVFGEGRTVDPVSVRDALGPEYQSLLVELMNITPTAQNLGMYIDLCRRQARVQRLKDIAQALAEENDLDAMQALVEQAVSVSAEEDGVRAYTLTQSINRFMERHAPGKEPEYLTWALPQLNSAIFAGKKDYVVLGGRPSTGKSALGIQLGMHWAMNRKVGFFSLETDEGKITDRNMAMMMQMDMGDIQRNRIEQCKWDDFRVRSGELLSRDFTVIEAAGWTVEQIRAYSLRKGFEIIIVDYLQLIVARGASRYEQVTNISMSLHTMAQTTGITVVALAQLARSQEDRTARLSDLRESGQIEQDADVVLLLSLAKSSEPDGPRVLDVAKNKQGRRPRTLLAFDGAHQTFSKAPDQNLMAQLKAARKQKPKPTPVLNQVDGQLEMLPEATYVPF